MKAPFKVLYSNDTTHILTCKSPYNSKAGMEQDPDTGQWVSRPSRFTAEMLEASVDETAGRGVDAHMLQPGVGWVPWWRSRVYPFSEHIKFMKERTGLEPSVSGYAQYMAEGGDMVKAFVGRCRLKGLSPFVSFRLNDSHGHEFVNMAPEQIPSWAWHVFCPTHVNHPEWRLSENLSDWNSRVLNWAIPEVREAKFAFIEEIIEQYDIDGFELDFMRHCNFFLQDATTSEQRAGIMNAFIGRVRAVLDRTAAPGQRRWLCVRVPAQMCVHDMLGIDLRAMTDAGVDMINLSNYYYTEVLGDVAAAR